jgi:hypothetical protein
MTNEQPFRFLDLPTELRLMVYEYLPIKLTHHKIKVRQPSRLYNGTLMDDGDEDPESSLEVIRKTIPGLAILASCRRIASEAGRILYPKLRVIRDSPKQIITNYAAVGSSELRRMLDMRSTTTSELFKDDQSVSDPLSQQACQTVLVAIRNNDSARDTTKRLQFLVWIFGMAIILRDWHTDMLLGQPKAIAVRDRHVHLRLALLTKKEEEHYGDFRILADFCNATVGKPGGPTLRIDEGPIIQLHEWESEWAEGERFWACDRTNL